LTQKPSEYFQELIINMSEEEKKPDSAMEEVNGDESAKAESSNPTSSERAERNSRRAGED
jgi:hypothetical protein